MKNEILRLRNVYASAPEKGTLKDFCMYVYEGEILGISGLHNTGKTLLLDCLSGQEKQTEGSIFWCNQPASQKVLADRRHIYRIRKISSLNPYMTVLENIGVIRQRHHYFQMIPWKSTRLFVQELVKEFRLDLNPNEYAGNLSMFQRCETEILRAYLNNSKLIILDDVIESFNAADLRRLEELLRQMKEKKRAFLVTGFRFSQLQRLSDRCLFIKDGMAIKTVENIHRGQLDEMKILLGYSQGNGKSYVKPGQRSDAAPLLQVENVCQMNGEPVTLSLFPGEIAVIVDPFEDYSSMIVKWREKKIQASGELLLNGVRMSPQSIRRNKIVKIADFIFDPKMIKTMSIKENLAFAAKLALPGEISAVYRNFCEQYKTRVDFLLDEERLTYAEKMAVYLECLKLQKWKVLFCTNVTENFTPDLEPIIKRQLRQMIEIGRAVCIFSTTPEKYFGLADVFLLKMKDNQFHEFSGTELQDYLGITK